MRRSLCFIVPIAGLMLTGCITDQNKTDLVAENPFGQTVVAQSSPLASSDPAALATAVRVDQVGRRVTAAN